MGPILPCICPRVSMSPAGLAAAVVLWAHCWGWCNKRPFSTYGCCTCLNECSKWKRKKKKRPDCWIVVMAPALKLWSSVLVHPLLPCQRGVESVMRATYLDRSHLWLYRPRGWSGGGMQSFPFLQYKELFRWFPCALCAFWHTPQSCSVIEALRCGGFSDHWNTMNLVISHGW